MLPLSHRSSIESRVPYRPRIRTWLFTLLARDISTNGPIHGCAWLSSVCAARRESNPRTSPRTYRSRMKIRKPYTGGWTVLSLYRNVVVVVAAVVVVVDGFFKADCAHMPSPPSSRPAWCTVCPKLALRFELKVTRFRRPGR